MLVAKHSNITLEISWTLLTLNFSRSLLPLFNLFFDVKIVADIRLGTCAIDNF
jgi:hypothetical protein